MPHFCAPITTRLGSAPRPAPAPGRRRRESLDQAVCVDVGASTPAQGTRAHGRSAIASAASGDLGEQAPAPGLADRRAPGRGRGRSARIRASLRRRNAW